MTHLTNLKSQLAKHPLALLSLGPLQVWQLGEPLLLL
jgi:hypothetical protein